MLAIAQTQPALELVWYHECDRSQQ